MRKKYLSVIIIGVVVGSLIALVVSGIFKTASAPAAELMQPVKSGRKTAADKQIESAQTAITANSSDAGGYNELAAAFMKKARETGDFSFNVRGEQALKYSFKNAPDNYDAIKLNAALLLNYHRFDEALKEAQRALSINSHDHETYGEIVDASVELGDYPGAVDAAQKMIDLRPNTASYSRVSYLRELHGDRKGAIEMMQKAVSASSPADLEGTAWCRVHLGDEFLNDGKLEDAEREYDHALYIFPDYHLALAAKARARYAAGDTENATAFYKRAVERVPLPDYAAALGDLYAKTNRPDEAKQQYDQVEFIEKTGANNGTYSRQLALFWADHDIRLDDALAAAQRERAVRSDVYSSDALAWCLYKKGRFDEAKLAADESLRIGTNDPKLLYHVGMIYAAAGDNKKGADYLKQALTTNPTFDILQAQKAKDKLTELKIK